MKHLIRKASSISLYHGTSLKRLDEIVITGIAAGANSTWSNTTKTQTFFSDEAWRALDYAGIAIYGDYQGNCRVVLEVNLDTSLLVPDNDDCPECETWEESLKKDHQVAVNGSVPASQIVRIELYDSYNNMKFWSGTVDKYLNDKDYIKENYIDDDVQRLARRLIVHKAAAITLYHGTTLNALNQIVKTGIAAGAPSAWENYSVQTNPTQTFFASGPEYTEQYCRKRWSDEGGEMDNYWVVLEVNLDTTMLQPDKDDCPSCRTWRESLDEYGQVAVNGSIPAYQIQNIQFYYPMDFALLYTCSFGNYASNPDGVLSQLEVAASESY